MDVHDPVTSRNKTPGFCDGERDGFAALVSSAGAGLVDVWRAAHPKLRQFTYWSARFNCRGNNKGWRLDYALVSPSLVPCVVSSTVIGVSLPCARPHAPKSSILTAPFERGRSALESLFLPPVCRCAQVDTFVRSSFPGADHVPLGLTLRLPTA
jgi:hypothetical protein